MRVKRKNVPQKHRPFNRTEYLPNHPRSLLANYRTARRSGKGQASVELAVRRKMHLVCQCETGAATASISKIATDPYRVDSLC